MFSGKLKFFKGIYGVGKFRGGKEMIEPRADLFDRPDSMDCFCMQVGKGTGKSAKKILLVRISPEAPAPGMKDEDDEDSSPAGDAVVH